MKNLEDFKKELNVIRLEERLEIVAVIDPEEGETICNGACCCID